MTSPGPFFGPVGTRTESAPARSFWDTPRGERVTVRLLVAAIVLGPWAASAIGYWLTGVPG